MADLDEIRKFLETMRERHQEQIDNVELPEGTREYLQSLVDAGDTEKLMFVLKLSYLMGLQTGFAISQQLDDEEGPDLGRGPTGPLEA